MVACEKVHSGQERPEVFGYQDLRTYLRDWIQYKQSKNANFSLNLLSKKAGFGSNCYISSVLSGSRRLTFDALGKLAPIMELSSIELAYLELLRCVSESKKEEERKRAFERLKSFSQHHSPESEHLGDHEYVRQWHLVAIREMLELPDFEPNPVWVSRRLKRKIPIDKISQALEYLKRSGEIREEVSQTSAEGRKNEAIYAEDGLYRLSLPEFYKEIFSLASQSIEDTSRDKRQIRGITVCVNRRQYTKLKKLIETFLNDATDIVRSEESTQNSEVYQLALSLFPLTQTKGGKNS